MTFLVFNNVNLNAQVVSTKGRDILVDGNKYEIRGICYNTVEIGKTRWDPQDYSHLDEDIQMMKNACINTIRVYNPIMEEWVLDKFAEAGIKVITAFGNFDDTGLYPDIKKGSYKEYIEKYKNHPAILMWEFGNEYNYHPEWFDHDLHNWIRILDNTAKIAKEIDPNHPISTAHGYVPEQWMVDSCPNLDVWGMNAYVGDNPKHAIIECANRTDKPIYLSETGGDRYNSHYKREDEVNQDSAFVNIYNHYRDLSHLCAGVTFFEWVDEWWKAKGSPFTQDETGFEFNVAYDLFASEEWWGFLDIHRQPKKAYGSLKAKYCEVAD